MKNNVKNRLKELGFSLQNFDEDYQIAIDNYNFEFNCNDAEGQKDFENYCIDNWK